MILQSTITYPYDKRADACRKDRKYREALRNIAADNGFVYLVGNPLIIDGVGFAGSNWMV